MNNQRRLKYFLVSIVTIFAAFIFLKTWVNATAYVPGSGSTGTAYISSNISAGASQTLPSDQDGMSAMGTSTISAVSATATTDSVAPVAAHVAAAMPAGYPVRLSIPSLKIDAVVQYLGVNSKGNLGVPNNFTDVGWYTAGTLPGDVGSAIIDGHVDNGLSLAGVFKHLSSIAIGDDVYVTDHSGAVIHFVVTNVQSYDYHDAPVDLIFDEHDGAFLKLITCGGTWVPGDRTYDQRVVVTAVLSA